MRVSAGIAMTIALVVMQIPSYFAPLSKEIPQGVAATILPSAAPSLSYTSSFDTPTQVQTVASQLFSFSWGITNTGTSAWSTATGNDVNLSVCVQAPVLGRRSEFTIECDQPSPNNPDWNVSWASPTRYAAQPTAVIPPGGVGIYDWSLRVPSDPVAGEYTFLATFVQVGTGARSQTFKQMVRVPNGNVIVVDSTSDGDFCDSGCTLRGAINQANANDSPTPTFDTIVFNVDGTTISLGAPLPPITGPVVIDATTEPSFRGTPVIELNGAGAGPGAVGLALSSGSGGSTIRGLAINQFAGWGIEATGGSVGLIAGNFVGTDRTGTLARGNGTSGPPSTGGGIRLLTGGESGYTVGTLALGDGNLVSGNIGEGIEIGSADAPGTTITSNMIGAGFDGLALPNGQDGLVVLSLNATVQDNVISNNTRNGIAIQSNSGRYLDNIVRNNSSGFFVSGSSNTFDRNDISANRSVGAQVGGNVVDNVFTDNTVRDNRSRGFHIFKNSSLGNITERNTVRRGSISGHTFEGIFNDTGPFLANDGILPPTLTVSDSGGVMTVSGTSRSNATIDVYVDPADEGRDFVGTTTADGTTWSFVVPTAVANSIRTGAVKPHATQTDTSGNTSGFSVNAGATITGTAECNGDSSPLLNVTVQLLQANTVLATTTSSATDGTYTFTGVGAGTFTVKFIFTVEEFERQCTVPVTLGGDGTVTFGEPVTCEQSNTWLTAQTLRATTGTSGLVPIQGVICDGGRRWYKIEMPAGGTIVPPLSRIVARLTGTNPEDARLPGDFTLMLVKDPLLALKQVNNAKDAHTQFAGDTFGGDTFGGDTFGGDTFGGDTFGGDTFGGDTFGGDTFGGDTFGGDTFGGDTFGGDTFGGDTFGGDTFGGDHFNDTLGLAGGDPKAYAAAVARSVVRVAAHRGTSPEGLWQNTWANSVTWYLRVSAYRGAAGAFNISAQIFSGLCDGVDTTPVVSSRSVPTSGVIRTLILRNSAFEAGADPLTTQQALQRFANHPTVAGFVVNFAGDMTSAYGQYQNKPFCPAAANLIADGIRAYVKAFKTAHPELQFVVIAATDLGVPVYRIPDYATLAPQSMLVLPIKPETVEGELRLNFYGTDDAYADTDPVLKGDHLLFQPDLAQVDATVPGGIRPGLSVGRISEPKYVPAMVDSYIQANGLLAPRTAAVYGYNFWSDTANSIKDQLAASGPATQRINVNGFPTAHPTIQSGQGLPTDPQAWNAQDLLNGVAADTDVFVLMAHGIRAAAIAPANYTPLVKPSQIIGVGNTTPAIKRMKLLITGACNFALAVPSAQNIPNVTPDPKTSEIPQALGWTAVAWDSYAYGDDERMAYSEELSDFLVRELRYGVGPVVLGDALARAKNVWASPQSDLTGIPEKSLMAMGIIGFPMLQVDLGTQGRLIRPSDLADFTSLSLTPVAAGTPGSNATLNLRTHDINVDFGASAHQLIKNNVPLTNLDGSGTTTASYYSVRTPDNTAGYVQMTPFRPIGPRWSVPLHPIGADAATFARGAVLLSATCRDEGSFVPLVSVPGYQLTPPRGPFLTDRFTPNDWWKINYLNPDREFLVLRPAQYRSATASSGAPEIFGTERTFTSVNLRAYYSSLIGETITASGGQTMQAILAGPPEVLSHKATPNGNNVDFEVFVSGLPNLGIQTVFVTWWNAAAGACAISSVELTQDTTNGQRWTGTLNLPAGTAPDQIRYLLQAVNGSGRVRVADNFGLGFPAETPPTLAVPLADTQLDFVAPPTPTSTFSGRTITVAARLKRTDTNANLSGKRLVFRLTGVSGDKSFAFTDSNGVATAKLKVAALPGNLFAHVEFEGDDDLSGSSARSAQIAVAREHTSFSATSIQPATQQIGGTIDVKVQLQDGLSRRLREQGVLFLITGTGCATYAAGAPGCAVLQAQAGETDFRGDARASFVLSLALGTYNVHAVFADFVQMPAPTSETLDLRNARYEPAHANLGPLSVSNQRIAFTSSRTGNGDIYTMNINGTGVARITDSSAIDADPDWSPDRTKIAFTSSRTGFGDVYVMNADGTGLTRLTTTNAIDTLGSWSPDGTKIAFTSTRDGNLEIYVMNADGTGQTRLTNNSSFDADPYWSPDGTKIAFTSGRTGNGDLYVMNANGTNVTRITNDPAVDTLGSWSPDGSKIVFTSGRTGNGDIYTMNPNGTGVTRLTTSSGTDGAPDWSPDGTKIVFASNRDGNSEIYLMNPDGTGQTRLTNNPSFDSLPSW